jgi:hypothetical protein
MPPARRFESLTVVSWLSSRFPHTDLTFWFEFLQLRSGCFLQACLTVTLTSSHDETCPCDKSEIWSWIWPGALSPGYSTRTCAQDDGGFRSGDGDCDLREVPVAIVEWRASNLARDSPCLVFLTKPLLYVLVPQGVQSQIYTLYVI